MRRLTLATLALGVAAGYLGARALMERETLPEQLPASVREPLERAQARLRRARAEAAEMLAEAGRVRAEAELELTAEYLRRVGREGEPATGDGEATDGGGEPAGSDGGDGAAVLHAVELRNLQERLKGGIADHAHRE